MEKFIRVLQAFRILDAEKNVSLTNLAVVASLVNLLNCHEVSLEAVSAFAATLIGYNVKRFAKSPDAPAVPEVDELREALKKLETSVTAIKMANSPTRRR